MRYDVVALFAELFPPDAAPLPSISPAVLPPDWHFAWDERAAILEYDAGMPREHAEAKALDLIVEQMKLAGEWPPR